MDWEQLSEILKALGHPLRLQVISILAQGEENVGALAEQMGVAQASLSQQLSILRSRGLVSRRRQNGRAIYSLAEPRLVDLVQCVQGCRRSGERQVSGAGSELDGESSTRRKEAQR